jgi:ribosomal protein S18 acetylase RimI-like enzyme
VFPEIWHLASLVVDTRYQRRGIGAMLLEWGIEQAQAEMVPCGLESSFAGKKLYEKMGFRTFDEVRFGAGERDVFAVMVWEPSGVEGRWLEKARAAVELKDGVESGQTVT